MAANSDRNVVEYSGTFVHCPTDKLPGQIQVCENLRVLVRESDGVIVHIASNEEEQQQEQQHVEEHKETKWNITSHVTGTQNELWVPGFVDCHVHAAQFQYTGTGTDYNLMEWLERHAFPAERNLSDLTLSEKVYTRLVDTLVAAGTTTAMYFGVLDLASCKVLVEVLRKAGQRALVGKVCMDRNSPDDYQETTQENLDRTRDFVTYVRESDDGRGLVLPVVTPRFVPTCSLELLAGLGDIAKEMGVHVQSHISESLDEIAFVESLHPGETDVTILREAGLLTDHAMMAHGVHLTKTEESELGRLGTAIAHCPLSNFFFGHGVMDVLDVLDTGRCRVGLGTDVAGGYSPSMLNAMRNAVITNHVIDILRLEQKKANGGSEMVTDVKSGAATNVDADVDATDLNEMNNTVAAGDEGAASGGPTASTIVRRKTRDGRADHFTGHKRLDFKDAFWLATVGGARALRIDDKIGNFECGKQFDALLVRSTHTRESDSILQAFERFVNLGDDRDVQRVYVCGQCVVDKDAC